tara:strand:+ start:403 stop:594 length:192 start_codon:yes stop_codon:yes gene_type:complete
MMHGSYHNTRWALKKNEKEKTAKVFLSFEKIAKDGKKKGSHNHPITPHNIPGKKRRDAASYDL